MSPQNLAAISSLGNRSFASRSSAAPCILGAALLVALILLPGTAAQAVMLNPGTSVTDPALGFIPSAGTLTTTLPSYFIPANVEQTATESITPTSGGISGTLVSTAYRDPGTGKLGFEYIFNHTGTTSLTGTQIGTGGDAWQGSIILDVGADATGNSTAASSPPNWTDGDPSVITRDPASSGAGISIAWTTISFGTELNNGNNSSRIFFEVFRGDPILAPVSLSGVGVSTSQALAPASVPEPSSLLLSAIALVGLGLTGRGPRRK